VVTLTRCLETTVSRASERTSVPLARSVTRRTSVVPESGLAFQGEPTRFSGSARIGHD
jgi:hypothetical protein